MSDHAQRGCTDTGHIPPSVEAQKDRTNPHDTDPKAFVDFSPHLESWEGESAYGVNHPQRGQESEGEP